MTRMRSPARPTRILHRQIAGADALPVAVAGRGLEIVDRDGRTYLDACGGAAVSCLGHGHPRVNDAMKAQIDRLAYAHTSFFTTDVAEALAARLVADAPAGIGHAYFVSGGSEAMEAALKMARQYFVERGEPQRTTFVARRQSYHGNTLGALAVGGNAMRRRQYAPLLFGTRFVAPPYDYRDRLPDETPQDYGARLAAGLEAEIVEAGPDTVIAFVAETVGGATQGCTTAPPGYFRAVREICDRHGILLVLDEVMCGMGRTGSLHACEQEGVSPDLMTIAKGLGGGYQPIGAVLVGSQVYEAFRAGSGIFRHGHTYLGHPVACAAALAVQDVIRDDGLVAKVAARGDYLAHRLADLLADRDHVGEIRGRGLFRAVEFVADRSTKMPFEPSLNFHARVKRAAMARGLLCYAMGGTIDGISGDHAMLAPPFVVDTADIDAIVARFGDAIDDAVRTIGGN